MSSILQEIDDERSRQDAKWGEQNHPNGTGKKDFFGVSVLARAECENAFQHGHGTWRHIFYEEVMEAFAESDPQKLRAELIQALAVGKAWIECIDRQAAQANEQT